MWQIVTEPNKEYIIGTKEWKNYDTAHAYCVMLNTAFPNIYFGVKPINDKYKHTDLKEKDGSTNI